jgi:hypothetical protein
MLRSRLWEGVRHAGGTLEVCGEENREGPRAGTGLALSCSGVVGGPGEVHPWGRGESGEGALGPYSLCSPSRCLQGDCGTTSPVLPEGSCSPPAVHWAVTGKCWALVRCALRRGPRGESNGENLKQGWGKVGGPTIRLGGLQGQAELHSPGHTGKAGVKLRSD